MLLTKLEEKKSMASFSEFSKEANKPHDRKDSAKIRIDPKTGKSGNKKDFDKSLNKVNSNPRTSSPSDRS